MPRLILLRHAKSDWDDPSLPDHDRVLNKRGRRACAAVGPWLAERGYQPDQVLCSTAARTVETWGLLSRSLPKAPAALMTRDLYLADPGTMLEILQGASGQCVAMVGHNPGVGELAAHLVTSAPVHADFVRFPTLSTLIVDFDGEGWAGVGHGDGRVVDFLVPRDLTDLARA